MEWAKRLEHPQILDEVALWRKGGLIKCGGFMNDIIFIVCTITLMITIISRQEDCNLLANT